MRRSPCTVLVCLTLLCMASLAYAAQNGPINVLIRPSATGTVGNGLPLPGDAVFATSDDPLEFQQAAARGRNRPYALGAAKPIVKCKEPVCPVGVSCPAPAPSPPCIVPRRLAGQWELGVQAFFAKQGGTVRYPGLVLGIPASTISLDNDLGLDEHHVLWEYSANANSVRVGPSSTRLCPSTWMPAHIAEHTLYIGHLVIPAGTSMKTNWDFVYQKVGLLYQPVFNCSSVVSIRAGWLFNDQKLTIGGGACPFNRCATVDRTRNMVFSGIEVERCIRTMCNGGTLSCDSLVDLGWLDGTRSWWTCRQVSATACL